MNNFIQQECIKYIKLTVNDLLQKNNYAVLNLQCIKETCIMFSTQKMKQHNRFQQQ